MPCISDAWGVKPKAAPGGQDGRIGSIDVWEIDAGEPGGGEPPRRLSGGHCGAHCARRCRAKCRRAPQERLHECCERCEQHCGGIGTAGDAPMRSMVQRRVTRERNATAIGERQRAGARAPREARARMTVPPRHRCAHAETGRAAAGATTRPAMRCGQAAMRWTGMPSCRALSTRFSVMPEPGNAITPFGRRFSSSSLRLNGAARPWRSQSGLQTTNLTAE